MALIVPKLRADDRYAPEHNAMCQVGLILGIPRPDAANRIPKVRLALSSRPFSPGAEANGGKRSCANVPTPPQT